MFDPHIYACQPLVGSNSNPTIQSLAQSDSQQKNQQSPTASPQKNKHVNSSTVIPIQTTGTLTPQRKQSQQEEGGVETNVMVTQLLQNSGSSSNSANNSRKTSTVSDNTPSSDVTPENTVLTPKDVDHQSQQQQLSATPTSSLDQVKASPVRKLSRFLVSPTVIETANHELIVKDGSHAPASSPQQSEAQQPIDLNINEENYQRLDAPETELQPQQSIGFRMPETLEQLKIELENITHAHVSTKAKEAQQALLQGIANQEADDSHEQISEAQIESSAAEYPSIDAITTGDNTSVYNSRRTSADLNTNPTDLTSTASGIGIEYEENLVSESVPSALEEPGPKMTQQLQQQMSIDR